MNETIICLECLSVMLDLSSIMSFPILKRTAGSILYMYRSLTTNLIEGPLSAGQFAKNHIERKALSGDVSTEETEA